MEVTLLGLLFALYLAINYFLTDHDTPSDKDRVRFDKGIQLLKNKEVSSAFTFFDDAIRQHPKSAIAYAFRGRCQLLQDNYYSAIYDLTQAISRDNTLGHCYLDRGVAYYKTHQFPEAFREFDKAVWHLRDEQPDAYRWRALARIQLRQLQQAENDLRRAVILGDENAFQLLRQPPFTRGNGVSRVIR